MPSPLLVDHHAKSLEGFEERLGDAMRSVFPLLPGADPIEFDSITLGPGAWKHAVDLPSWVRPVHLTVKTAQGAVSRVIADLPWLCDIGARVELNELQGNAAPGYQTRGA